MKILLDGYFDGNFGDDLMLTLAARGLEEHELFVPSKNINITNARYTDIKKGFDFYLKVTGSGFLIHNNFGLPYRARDMLREKNYAPCRAVINCNISPFINRAAQALVCRQLSLYDFITVRDEYSYNFIKLNAPNPICEKYPDMVFSLPDSLIPDVKSEGALGISVRTGADNEALAEIADRYISQTGKAVLLLCFDRGAENDISAAENICESSKSKNMIEIIRYKDTSSMLANIKRCDVILGIRLHSVILAARMGISFVPAAYSGKMNGALRELGYEGRIYTAKSLDADDVMKSILEAKPYCVNQSAAASAQKHITRLREYLKTCG